MHGGEQAAAENTCDAQYVEGVHQDVVLGLEHQHVVEGAKMPRGIASEKNPDRRGPGRQRRLQRQVRCRQRRSGAHAQAVGEFPLATHVGVDADEEVENNQLEGAAVVQPLIEEAASQMG